MYRPLWSQRVNFVRTCLYDLRNMGVINGRQCVTCRWVTLFFEQRLDSKYELYGMGVKGANWTPQYVIFIGSERYFNNNTRKESAGAMSIMHSLSNIFQAERNCYTIDLHMPLESEK